MWPDVKRILLAATFLLVFCLAISACAAQDSDINEESTIEAISATIRQTATSLAAENLDPNAAIETAQAQATASSQSAEATHAAQVALGAEAKAATTTAFEPFLTDLPEYGVDPSEGQPGWIHPPATLEVEGYMQYDYINQFIGTVARDFVVSADITWNTQYGSSGCGFVLRSDGNQDALNQYLTIATRAASGHVLFATMAKGEVVTGRDIYAYGIDPNFRWQNDTTNRLTIVGRGNKFSIYTNETLIGEVNPSDPPPQPYIPPAPKAPADVSDLEAMALYQQQQAEYEAVVAQIRGNYRARQEAFESADTVFDRGFIAMVALNESGKTICQFDSAWLWLIDS